VNRQQRLRAVTQVGKADMQYRAAAFLAGSFLVLASHLAIAAEASSKEASLRDVNRALASPEPAVLIGVPASFLNPGNARDSDDDAAEAQDDWSFYLNEWRRTASKRKLNIIVVPMNVLSQALQRPALKGECATLFVKKRTEGLLFDAYCVLQVDDYDLGARWLDGTASAHDIADHDFKTTAVVARARR
jgi:hypothetical protein